MVKYQLPTKRKRLKIDKIQTTLYDLMETVIDVSGPDENDLVNEVTRNILTKAKSKYSVLNN